MENFKRDGVYLNCTKTKKKGITALLDAEPEWISYFHFLFCKNYESGNIEIYHGAVAGDIIAWLQKFSSEHELEYSSTKVKSFNKVTNNRISLITSTNVEGIVTVVDDGRLHFSASSDQKTYPSDYIFISFAPYYRSYRKNDY